jgi:hypothetical protein
MFFGAVCHDVDHRGFNNQFLQLIKSPIGLLYQTSTMECHHLDHTLYLLQVSNRFTFSLHDLDRRQEKRFTGMPP